MTEIIAPTRRGFIQGLVLLLAAPAIVRVASLMPVKSIEEEIGELVAETDWGFANGEAVVATNGKGGILTIQMITREAVSVWKNSNKFLNGLQYDDSFALDNSTRIRLPKNYRTPPPWES